MSAPRLDPAVERVDHGSWVAITSAGGDCLRLTPAEAAALASTDEVPPGLVADLAVAGLLEASTRDERRVRLTRTGIELDGANRPLGFAYRTVLRHLFHAPVLLSVVAIAVVGAGALIEQLLGGRYRLAPGMSPAILASALLVLDLLAVVRHETAHGLVLVRHGRGIRRVGFGFYWGLPTFYVDASEALLLPRRARMTQSAAGPLSDVVAAGACSVGSLFVHGAPATVLVLHAVFLWLAVITNLVPFLELDGYWVLSDHLDRPQLHAESVAAARRMAASPVRGATRLGAYGVVSTLFGAGMLVVGLVAWWAVIGDVVVALAGGGAVGLLIAALLALPTVGAWLTLAIQLAVTAWSRLVRGRAPAFVPPTPGASATLGAG